MSPYEAKKLEPGFDLVKSRRDYHLKPQLVVSVSDTGGVIRIRSLGKPDELPQAVYCDGWTFAGSDVFACFA